MSDSSIKQAKVEIDRSLVLSTFCMRRIGLSFEKPKSTAAYLRQKLMFVLSVSTICYHVFSEIVYIGLTLSDSPRVEDVVPLFHTFGYGALSIAKVFVLWYKKDVFTKLLQELAEIWPMAPLNEEYESIKNKSLDALRIAHRWYFMVNVTGVWFYNLTPIVGYFYQLWQGNDATIGFVWVSWYPLDKHQPVAHVFVYLFEIFAVENEMILRMSKNLTSRHENLYRLGRHLVSLRGFLRKPNEIHDSHSLPPNDSVNESKIYWYMADPSQELLRNFMHDRTSTSYSFKNILSDIGEGVTCVWIMVSTDLLFSGMASHIGLLLRLLHHRLESIGTTPQTDEENYLEIVENIKLHQRLIKYCNDLEIAFSPSNFVNVVLSSINICCVVFVIFLLEPLPVLNSKLFLGSALIQIGMLCWYADDIYYANADVAMAAYRSNWYTTNPRCRRALLFLIKRAQKPIAFTAMNFTDINLVTYSSIISRSYSYFALLYTMYREN